MDITGLQSLEQVITSLQQRGVTVMLAGANDRVVSKLRRSGVLQLLAAEHCYAELEQALRRAQQALV